MENQIIRNVEQLLREDQLKVLNFLHNKHVKISTCADGTRVNLSVLDPLILAKLDQFITALMVIQELTRISI
jgi:hypothetical protein